MRNRQEPPQKIIDQIAFVLDLPYEQIPAIEKDAFEQYVNEIFPIYSEQLLHARKYYGELKFKEELVKLPTLESQNEVWQLFGRSETIGVTNEELSLEFVCNFDSDHRWNFVFKDKTFCHVYLG